MPPIFDLEIDLILWLRDALPGLVGPFELFTFLGNEMFFLIMLPFVYWCLDRRTGARLTVLFLLSTYANGLAKALFDIPRPIDVAPGRLARIFPDGIDAARETYDATSSGFPSGHTQLAVTVWGYLASRLFPKDRPAVVLSGPALLRPLLLAAAALLIVMVPLSRIYLGVHFPHDIAGGYVLGTLMLALFLWLAPGVEARLATWPLDRQIALAVALPVLLVVSVRQEYAVTAAGTLLGMGVGFVLERRWVRFETAIAGWRELWRVALRFALGVAVMLALYAGLKAAFAALAAPDTGPEALVFALRFVRYTLMGLWGSIGAPWAFVKLGLAGRPTLTAAKLETAG